MAIIQIKTWMKEGSTWGADGADGSWHADFTGRSEVGDLNIEGLDLASELIWQLKGLKY